VFVALRFPNSGRTKAGANPLQGRSATGLAPGLHRLVSSLFSWDAKHWARETAWSTAPVLSLEPGNVNLRSFPLIESAKISVDKRFPLWIRRARISCGLNHQGLLRIYYPNSVPRGGASVFQRHSYSRLRCVAHFLRNCEAFGPLAISVLQMSPVAFYPPHPFRPPNH
jgi:hypothetical protein